MPAEIDPAADELLTLAQAARHLPSRPSPCTLWRWRTKGVNGVRLPCVRVGARWCTTLKALGQFIREQTEATSVSLIARDGPRDRPAATIRRLQAAGLL